jgi:hypothetical protein
MGTPAQPKPARYFASVIFNEETLLDPAEDALVALLGDLAARTPVLPFDLTRYYEKEMGQDLKRVFLLFQPLRRREELTEIKLATNEIEQRFCHDAKRKINIDAGYMSLEQVILATTKGYSHRVYLGRGIYADLTLIYQDASFRPLQWTYPDYGGEGCISMFNGWREIYKTALREERKKWE